MTDGQDTLPRRLLVAALTVAVVATLAVLVVAITQARRAPAPPPLVIAEVPAPLAESAECTELVAAIPEQLGDYARATPARPAPPGTAGWEPDSGTERIVLRCGLDPPVDFVVGAPIQVVNSVQWFQISDASDAPDGRSTWFAVDRPVYVALTLPHGSGPTPIQQLSDVIAAKLPATPIDPGPPR